MPNNDKTGPEGKGPMTGRGLGSCGNGVPADGRGQGRGRGLGAGKGLGLRKNANANNDDNRKN